LFLDDLQLDWFGQQRSESEEESKKCEEEENNQENHDHNFEDEEGGEPVAVAVSPGLDLWILESVGVSQQGVITEVVVVLAALLASEISHALCCVEEAICAWEGKSCGGVTSCRQVEVSGSVEGVEDVEDGNDLEDEDHNIEGKHAGGGGQETEDDNKDDEETVLPHWGEVKREGEESSTNGSDNHCDFESTVGTGGGLVGEYNGNSEREESQEHQEQRKDEDQNGAWWVQLLNGGAMHENDSEVVVVPSVSWGVSALSEVAGLRELVAAGVIAAPLILQDTSNTVTADLISHVDASTQAPLAESGG
jgi:hypothetical protein